CRRLLPAVTVPLGISHYSTFPRRSGHRSRIEPLGGPAVRRARIDQPLVQAKRPLAPELDSSRHDAEPGPVRRPRDLALAKARLDLGDAGFELGAVGQRARLQRGPGADLRAARPRTVIGVRLRLG